MDAMISALKKRRIGGEQAQAPAGESNLKGLVASLSDDEKNELLTILQNDENVTQEIQKGGPSTEERADIDKSISEENAQEAVQAEDDLEGTVDSDEIGRSMLDSRYTGQGPTPKPRNLGERVKGSIAEKLKTKGKI